MPDQHAQDEQHPQPAQDERGSVTAPVTGSVPSAEAVAAAVTALEDRPLAEHAPVYERAVADLRSVLDAG